ncbi:MAG TPA: glutamate synthase [Maritimibacter sp.]|nr:glutamate synthase [Maritimibacter sp.]
MPNDAEPPIIAAKSPVKVDLSKGKTYYWCRCGRSANQPFCDGSHKGTGLAPVEFTADEDGDAYLCRCKGTGDQPFCDGTHKKLPDDVAVGDPVPDELRENDGEAPKAEATPEEPTVARIHEIARKGLQSAHGTIDAMGVPGDRLPKWADIQILPAQLAQRPLMDDAEVATETVIGPRADKPLTLSIPLFVTDMSFGALSPEAKIALAKGAEAVGTGIASGEGGMLPEEQAANRRYFFEYASAGFGWSWDVAEKVQAFHFKGGQAAKTGIGGHLPASKVTDKIAEVRGLKEGEEAISPATFPNLETPTDFARFADEVRDRTGGIPIGFKISANHIEDDIDFALDAGADYIILDGRGGGTGAAPLLFRDNISIPTIPALARARAHLDRRTGREVTLVITGGLRMPEDFAKALALGADAVALGNSAIQAVGCVAARMCHTNNCPTGVATQKPELRKRLNVDEGGERLARFFDASTEMMKALARACGHDALDQFRKFDITTFDRNIADLTGIRYAGIDA